PLHILDPLAGQPQQCQPDGNAHLADDAEAVAGELEEQVVGFADRARQGVLDRRNSGVGRAVAYRFENAPPGWNRHGGGLSEIPLGGLLAERPRLALKRDAHRLRHDTLNDQPPFALTEVQGGAPRRHWPEVSEVSALEPGDRVVVRFVRVELGTRGSSRRGLRTL